MKNDGCYGKFQDEKLILRDYLATDRTILANERTVLAYIRTALTALVAGLTLIKFFTGIYYQSTGWIFIAIGVVISIYGIKRCTTGRKDLEKLFAKK